MYQGFQPKSMLMSNSNVGIEPNTVFSEGLIGEHKPKKIMPTDAQLQAFGNYGGPDVKTKASYLGKKGLIGSDQLFFDHPDISTKNGIINAQSDWKTSAIGAMLMRARTLNLRTPTEIKANRTALLGSLRPELAKAINHPSFNQIHPNFWGTFDSILKDQYANEDINSSQNTLAVK